MRYTLEKCRPMMSGMCWWKHATYTDLPTLWNEAQPLLAEGYDVRIVLTDRDTYEEHKARRISGFKVDDFGRTVT